MICNYCGKELPENARICCECGTPVISAGDEAENGIKAETDAGNCAPDSAEAAADGNDGSTDTEETGNEDGEAEAAPAGTRTGNGTFGIMISNSLKILRGFFSRYTFPIVSAASKSKTPEGLLFTGLCALLFAFALPINLSQYDALSDCAMLNFNVFGLFGMGLLSAAAVIYVLIAALFLLLNVILKKKVGIVNVLNAVGVSSIPMSCAFLVNMFLGFWTPAALIALAAAAMISFALLRHGFLCLSGGKGSDDFFPFVIALTLTFCVFLLFMYLTYTACVSAVILSRDLFPV